MSAKPTPGPYRIQETINGFEVVINESHDRVIARFPRGDAGEGKANARAWVDGMAAMDTLKRIHEAANDWGESRAMSHETMLAIAKILDEAKP